jgi:hypothetical protein
MALIAGNNPDINIVVIANGSPSFQRVPELERDDQSLIDLA